MEQKCALYRCSNMVPIIQEGKKAPMLQGEPICDHCELRWNVPIPKSKHPTTVEPKPEPDTRCNETSYHGEGFDYPAHLPIPRKGQTITRFLIPWKAGETKWKWKYVHSSVEAKGRSPRTT